MRPISEALQAHLNSGATTLCRCWELHRKDGVVMGFSDHDKDLTFEGVLFAATSGLDARALQSSSGLSVDNSEALGALSDAGLRAEDIEAGVFDSAEVKQWLVNWAEPDQRVLMFRGYLGEIRHGPNVFEAELQGLTEKLNRNVGRSYLRQCSAQLGDGNCGFDTDHPDFSNEATVKRAKGNRVVFSDAFSQFEEGWFNHGRLTWVGGKNAGKTSVVRTDVSKNNERRFELAVEAPNSIENGDSFRIVAGCDKQIGTCRAKFDNVINFFGFPFIPGEDWALAYPVRGKGSSGGSLTASNE